MDADAVELRVLGCLLEKQRTTPDAYPLSLNALRLACNQSTNRDPVVDYDEATIRDALARLYRRRWTRLAGAGRAAKYRHLLDEALDLAPDELAILAVLMLRGAQTPGELNQRAARLHPFAGLGAVQETLERLVGRSLAQRLPRRPGQKEERYVQLLGGGEEAAAAPADSVAAGSVGSIPAPTPPEEARVASAPAAAAGSGQDARLAELERELADLRAQVAELRSELGLA